MLVDVKDSPTLVIAEARLEESMQNADNRGRWQKIIDLYCRSVKLVRDVPFSYTSMIVLSKENLRSKLLEVLQDGIRLNLLIVKQICIIRPAFGCCALQTWSK